MSEHMHQTMQLIIIEQRRAMRMEHKYESILNGAAHCFICGQTDPRTFEFHHLYGSANSPVGKKLCKNCHAICSDMQQDLPKGMLKHAQKTPAEQLSSILLGVALLVEEFAVFVVTMLRSYGEWLYENRSQITLPALPVVEGA